MKAVLISIQPKWVAKIANGEKTIEVRKTAPKCEEPFKCYIYCTKASKKYQTICGCMVINTDELYRLPNGEIKHDWSGELMCCNGEYTRDNFLNGKAIGEFVCDKVFLLHPYTYDGGNADRERRKLIQTFEGSSKENEILAATCLTQDEMFDYIGAGNYGYGWHISELKIYDKPKELSEFERPCTYKGICYSCERFRPNGIPLPAPYGFCETKITRAPQGWCYVEEL